MTPQILQAEIAETLKLIFNDIALPTVNGSIRSPSIYMQDLPAPNDDEEEDDADVDVDASTAPYLIVRINEGSFESWDDALIVKVILIICIYDKSPEKQGHCDVLSLIAKVFNHFAEKPNLGVFECDLPIEWALQTEIDTFPYYYGALEMNFKCPGVRRKDDFA